VGEPVERDGSIARRVTVEHREADPHANPQQGRSGQARAERCSKAVTG
jgi:hypothetical protein